MSNDRPVDTSPLFGPNFGKVRSTDAALDWGRKFEALAHRLPYQSHSPTSQAAARSLHKGWLTRKRLAVWSAIRNAPTGLTDEEGCRLTGLNPSTYRPRRNELADAKMIEDTGETRPSGAGRPMVVWRAKA